MDQDQELLLSCLVATLDTNQDVRSLAEASLQEATLRPGFGVVLCKIAVNKDLQVGLRQLAAVLLKQLVKQHWHEDDDNFVYPVLPLLEKNIIRENLLSALNDPQGKICTAVSMAVASIALYDWPTDWPDLLPFLLNLISDHSNMGGVHGALRCLSLISSDVDDKLAPTLLATTFPSLYNVISSPHVYFTPLRSKALSVVHSCISIIGAMSGVYQNEIRGLIMPMIKPWMEQFALILRPPVSSYDPDDWTMRIEVLKCLIQFVQYFSKYIREEFTVILEPLWQTFLTCLNSYESSAIQGADNSYSERVDSDGTKQSLEAFAIQLFEFLLTLVGNSRLSTVFDNHVKELVYYTLAYLQMTEEQVNAWLLDANQYVFDEDNATFSCRVSGILLLEEIITLHGANAIDALIEGFEKRFVESSLLKESGSTNWWKMQEAALFALCSLSEPLSEEQLTKLAKSQLANIIEQMLPADLGPVVYEQPFLYARLFSTLAKLPSVIFPGSVTEQFLAAASRAITLDVSSPVKVGACRAIPKLLPLIRHRVIQPYMGNLFSSLINLLKQASDETLHLVLEALRMTIKSSKLKLIHQDLTTEQSTQVFVVGRKCKGHEEISVSVEPVLSPIILNLWVEYASDPFICIDIVDVLEELRNAPKCMWPLLSRILPFVCPILENFEHQPDGLVAASLDLLTMLLKNASIEVVKAVHGACFNNAVRVSLRSDDSGHIQNATECLAAFILGGKQELLSWGGDPGLTLRYLLDVASRLLDPSLDTSGSLFVGTYIMQLIVEFPMHMAQVMGDLVAAIVRRMHSCHSGNLKCSLLLIFARLVHLSVPNVEQFIDLLAAVPCEGNTGSLSYVMSEWTKHQSEILGSYSIKITTTALALLLSTKHVDLWRIQIQDRLVEASAGIRTRSKAKLAPEEWIMIPLPAKILALLADMLIEMQESEIDDAHDDQGDDDDDVDFTKGNDPINQVNLVGYIGDFITKFCNSDRPLFDHLCESLSHGQRIAINVILRQPL